MDVTDRIAHLAAKLQELRKRDRDRAIFGARQHKYDLTPASEEALARLEARIGATLPSEYRTWLLKVGYGAGPYYGLFSPQQVTDHLRYHERGSGGDVASAAKIGPEHVDQFVAAVRAAGTHVGVRITVDSFAGAVPISHQGCNGYSHIIVGGAYRGAIFGECDDIIGKPWTAVAAFWPDLLSPASGGKPLSFLHWIESWLDTSLATLP